MDVLQEIAQSLAQIKAKKPLVHHLTNYVTVNDCANITLAIGASPVMANDISEVEEMAAHASAMVLNIGALNPGMAASMLAAGKKAGSLNIPVVFDPVGVGATSFRMEIARQIISEVKPIVIKGNVSEIKALNGLQQGSKGVDSIADEGDAEIIGVSLAKKLGCVVAITGKTDIVTDGKKVYCINNGHQMLAGVTGTGCMATSLIASCCGAGQSSLAAAAFGVTIMGIAGEIAHQQLKLHEGLGTFRMRIFDAVSTMSPDTIMSNARICADKGEN